jgi:hypothetical protein
MEGFGAVAIFLALHIFLIACMFHKFSENNYFAAIYNSSKIAKGIAFVGMIGTWVYFALCADWIRNPWALEFSGPVAFVILGATMCVLATGDWGPEYE